MSKDLERVLCIPRQRLDELGTFQGSCRDTDHYIPALFEAPHPLFLARGECEEDPSFKQLIPYILVEWRGQLFRYLRGGAGGEARLHAKASLGIGGHVNDQDGADASREAEAIFARGLERELDEELHLAAAAHELIALGLINDESDPVGQVHLGVCYLARFEDSAELTGRDESIENAGFLSLEDIVAAPEPLESWSVLALELYQARA